MTAPGFADSATAKDLQSTAPDPRDERRLVEWLLIPVWRVFSDVYLEQIANDLQRSLSPAERAMIEAEDAPLHG